jgi:splicing factor 3B subunit 1
MKNTSQTTSVGKSDSEANSRKGTEDNDSMLGKVKEPRKSRFSDSVNTEVSVVRTKSMWDNNPGDMTPRKYGETPTPGGLKDTTPLYGGETPFVRKGKSNWDVKTPVIGTPNTLIEATPVYVSPSLTKFNNMGTPAPNQFGLVNNLTPERIKQLRWEKELEERNRPLTDEELDDMIKVTGYEVRNSFPECSPSFRF